MGKNKQITWALCRCIDRWMRQVV